MNPIAVNRVLPYLLLLSVAPAIAGGFDALPPTERGFQEKVQAYIKPGNGLEDSLKLLEADRFECREFRNKYPVFHCSRMEAPRYYQVLIEPASGGRVKSVEPSLGIVRQ